MVFENSRLGLSLTGTSIVDSDRDGLDDNWELAFFDNLSQGAYDDFEADGRNNLLEYSSGGNPTTTGDLAETRFTIENIGDDDASDVLLRDAFPVNTQYVAGSTTLGSCIPTAAGWNYHR